jgi:biopolymer transport protein ExbB
MRNLLPSLRRLPLFSLLLIGGLVALSGLGAAEVGAEGAKKGHTLIDLIWLAGPIELVLIILSVIAYSLGITWVITIKRATMLPDHLIFAIHDTFNAETEPSPEDIESLHNAAAADSSMLGQTVAAMLDNRDFGFDSMKEAMETAAAVNRNKIFGKISWLSLFASSATLLGLLGTVSGIIKSFLAIQSNPGGLDANALAGSIGEALVCTATGLTIAIGNIYLFFWLRGRLNQCSLELLEIVGEVLDNFRAR